MENLYENVKLFFDDNNCHAGGWDMTEKIIKYIKPGDRVLDICCGNGETSKWIQENIPNTEVYGIDMSRVAIEEAQNKETTAQFFIDNLIETRFKSDYFDIIIGQEPDAFAEMTRNFMFIELHRILKPNGILVFFHHWIPSSTWTSKDIMEYYNDIDEKCIAFTANDYIKGLVNSNFGIFNIDKTFHKIAEKHIRKQYVKYGNYRNSINVKYLDKGFTFGIFIACRKIKL